MQVTQTKTKKESISSKTIRITDQQRNIHYRWSQDIRPIASVDEGDILIFECRDGADDQLSKNSKSEDLVRLDTERVHALSGPIYVNGAEPGDALEVEILAIKPRRDWGFTMIAPGHGNGLISNDVWATLTDASEYQNFYLKIWKITESSAEFGRGISVPLSPFMGIMGVAPKRKGTYRTMPASPEFGGNTDIKQFRSGSKVLYPVHNKGALFSVGDGHAAQGDGEVCLTAIETANEFTCKFRVIKDLNLSNPRAIIPPQNSSIDENGFYLTTGIHSNVMAATRQAVKEMVDWLQREHSLTIQDAYVLISACGDLKLSQATVLPNWVVSCAVPRSIFGKA